jgi:Spy/CpxP family protein refolding chaperone
MAENDLTPDQLARMEAATSSQPTAQEEPKPQEQPETHEPVTAEKPVETPEPEVSADEPPKDGKAWAEMRHKLKEAEEKLAQKDANPLGLAEPAPVNPYQMMGQTPPPVAPDPTSYVDDSGTFDQNRYNVDMARYGQDMIRVSSETAKNALQEEREETELAQVFPDVKKGSNEYRRVVNLVATSMLDPQAWGGQRLTLKQAADIVLSRPDSKQLKQVADQAREAALEEVSEKERANLGSLGTSANATRNTDQLQEMRQRIRNGDNQALADRIKDF